MVQSDLSNLDLSLPEGPISSVGMKIKCLPKTSSEQ